MSNAIDKLELFVVVPKYGVNLVKNPHPRTTWSYIATGGSTVGLASELSAPYNTYSRRGADCLYFTPVASTASGVGIGLALSAGATYTFAADILTTEGEPLQLLIYDTTAWALAGSLSFTASGDWERRSLTFTCPTTDTYSIRVTRAGTSANNYMVFTDGWQVEAGTRATTFIIGDEPGFGEGDYYWSEEPYKSSSIRSGLTRHGGYLLRISDYAMITAMPGLGMGTFTQIMTDMVSGGALYQDFIRTPRTFSVVLEFAGSDTKDLHEKRRTLIDALRPDYAGGGQTLVLRYQGFDNNGVEATQPLDIECVLMSGLQEIPTLPTYHEDVLIFNLPDGHIRGAFQQGMGLEMFQTLTQANNIVKRTSTGAWSELGAAGLNGLVYAIAEAPNGTIFVGGAFTQAGGEAKADYLAKYNPWTNTWSAVTANVAPSAAIRALAFDANGNLYVGGDFVTLDGITGATRIAKIANPTSASPTITAMGTGANNSVHTIAIKPTNGHVYIGGAFTSAGGVADTSRIAYWNGSTWVKLKTGLNNTVYAIEFSTYSVPYIGGLFTNAVSTNVGNYFVYWNGAAFVQPSTFKPNGSVRALRYVKSVGIYVGGTFTGIASSTSTLANSKYVALWNGVNWKALSTSVNSHVYALEYGTDGRLYIGGNFTSAGTLIAQDKIVEWKTGAFSAVDIDLPIGGGEYVQALFISKNGTLYLGGAYTGSATTGKYISNYENNMGSANTFPNFTITGPGTLRSLVNYSTGKRINFTDLILQEGETITINLDPTNLSMISSWSGRKGLLGTIAAGSDHGDFYLAPGSNAIQVYMPTGTIIGTTKAWTNWTPKYWSIEGAVNY